MLLIVLPLPPLVLLFPLPLPPPPSSSSSSFSLPLAVCSVPQSCPTLCDPMDCSPPASSVHGISQARILE